MEVFWACKDVFFNDELVVTVLDYGDLTMHVINNCMKKQVSCRDNSLPDGLQLENNVDFENMSNTVQDLCNEELHGKGSFTSKEDVQGYACDFGADSRSEERSEDNIVKGDEEAWVQENSERHEKGNKQVNGHWHDNVKYGDGVGRRNSNVVKRQRFEWHGAECNFVDNDGVFIVKVWAVACGSQEAILDDQLGEDHVGLCILYCPGTMSIMMTIWKWLLVQTILDGYPLKEHFITFNETHIPDGDDVGELRSCCQWSSCVM